MTRSKIWFQFFWKDSLCIMGTVGMRRRRVQFVGGTIIIVAIRSGNGVGV